MPWSCQSKAILVSPAVGRIPGPELGATFEEDTIGYEETLTVSCSPRETEETYL